MNFPFTYFSRAPKFSIWHSHPGQKSAILITAGLDGDEYQAIDLAKQFISTYHQKTPVSVIPIVNLAGYQKKLSYNPLDGLYPKNVYPGSRFGSSTARLMYQISQLSATHKLWIDLHSEATGETLFPFAWASRLYPFLSYLKCRVLVEPSVDKKMPYVMLEHASLNWINSIIQNLDKPKLPAWHPTYTKIHFAPYRNQSPTPNTLWYSEKLFCTGS